MNQSIPSFSCNDPKMHLRFSWTCAFVSGHSIMFHQSSFLFVAISNRLDDANLLISLNIQESRTSLLPCSSLSRMPWLSWLFILPYKFAKLVGFQEPDRQLDFQKVQKLSLNQMLSSSTMYIWEKIWCTFIPLCGSDNIPNFCSEF